MEILDIAKEQLNSANQRQTLEKYHDFFEEIREFGPKDQNYLQAVRKRVEQLGENIAQKGRDRIEEVIKEKELKTALNMELQEYKNYIFRYFDL